MVSECLREAVGGVSIVKTLQFERVALRMEINEKSCKTRHSHNTPCLFEAVDGVSITETLKSERVALRMKINGGSCKIR